MSEVTTQMSARQGAELALQVLGGQWVVAVLTALAPGELSFTHLLTAINSVDEYVGRRTHHAALSRQVLSPTLDRMAKHGLLVRIERRPRSVSYQLTVSGHTLLHAVQALAAWAQEHHQVTDDDAAGDLDEEVGR